MRALIYLLDLLVNSELMSCALFSNREVSLLLHVLMLHFNGEGILSLRNCLKMCLLNMRVNVKSNLIHVLVWNDKIVCYRSSWNCNLNFSLSLCNTSIIMRCSLDIDLRN